jgi:minichromosome maintenance protein 10
MESSSRRFQEDRKKQDELRKQIASLQAQLVDLPDEVPRSPARAGSKKRQGDSSRGTILAPPTPSPKSELSQERCACSRALV